jgi:hypothetical protein
VNAADEPVLAETARHILRPDEDLSGFYEAAHDDPDLAWATDGSGRMLRSRRSSRTSSTQMIRGELLISRERTARRSSLTLDAFPRKTRSTKPRLNAGRRPRRRFDELFRRPSVRQPWGGAAFARTETVGAGEHRV